MLTDSERKAAASIGLSADAFEMLKERRKLETSMTEEERDTAEKTGLSPEAYCQRRNEYDAERAADDALWADLGDYAAEAATTAPRGRGLPLPEPEEEP